MTVSLIAARSENDVIGRDQGIPWHLPADLRHFKRLTTGHTIIMGRKTFECIGRALPDRRTIVVTRNDDFAAESIVVASSLDEAIRISLEEPFEADGEVEVFVVGGGEIYQQALGRADRLYLTRVHTVVEGTVTFPAFVEEEWECRDTEWHAADEKNPFDYTFETWERQ
jgi:dihydrofolate reductase